MFIPMFVKISQRVLELLRGHDLHNVILKGTLLRKHAGGVKVRILCTSCDNILCFIFVQNFMSKSFTVFEMWSGNEMLAFEL